MPTLPPADLVCFPTEGRGLIPGDHWRGGAHALLLLRDDPAEEGPWRAQIPDLVAHGLTLLEPAPPPARLPEGPEGTERYARIVAGAVAYLRNDGAAAVSVLAAGRGAEAAGEAVLSGLVGNLHTMILLAPPRLSGPLGRIAARVIFVVADEDEAVDVAVAQHAMAADTTQLTLYTGEVPAVELFRSPRHAKRLLKLVTDALPAAEG